MLQRIEKEIDYNFFQPKHELLLIDKKIIHNNTYTESRKKLGIELHPIYVAINFDDPLKESNSVYRIHARILNGNHRYQDTKKANTRWSDIKYLAVKSYKEFVLLWTHFHPKKDTEEKQAEQRIIDYCNYIWQYEGERLKDQDGLPDKQNVASEVIKDLLEQKQYGRTTIYNYIPEEFKIQKVVQAQKARKKKLSKKDIKIKQLEEEKEALQKELYVIREQSRPQDKKDMEISSLRQHERELQITIGNIKSELKELTKSRFKTSKEFDQWFESLKPIKVVA
jgi:hypothetical protein